MHSLYFHIYIFLVVSLRGFFFGTKSNQIQIIFKQIYLTHRWDPIRYYHSRSEWTWEWWQWRGTPHSPVCQNWSLTIRCSLVSYPGHPFFERISPLCVGGAEGYSILSITTRAESFGLQHNKKKKNQIKQMKRIFFSSVSSWKYFLDKSNTSILAQIVTAIYGSLLFSRIVKCYDFLHSWIE